MPRAILAYNNTIHSATGFTPVELVFGHPPRNRGDLLTAMTTQLRETVSHRRRRLVEIGTKAREKLIRGKETRAARIATASPDQSHRVKLGLIVYCRPPSRRNKGEPKYEGPFRVVALKEHNIVSIQEINGRQRVKCTPTSGTSASPWRRKNLHNCINDL